MNDDVLGANLSDDLFLIFAFGVALILFWFLETVWRNERRGLIFIFFFPPCLLYFIIKYWEETRAKCFFAALFWIMMILINAVTHNDFTMRLLALLQVVGLWPYYVFMHFKHFIPIDLLQK
jgi:hypothetical protein